jgi:uncharacterized protein (TIGR02246 family)
MRRRTVMLAGAAAFVAMPASLRAQAPSAALHAWVEAFNTRDPKRIVALYARDAVFWGTAAKTIATTPESIWAYFKDAGQRPWTRVTIDAQHERVYGDTAIVSGAYTFSDVRDGVATNVRPARFTFVFRRDGDRWQIVDHHSSRVPEP